MFVRVKKRGERTYLMIVENQRVDGRVKQKVLHNLGRLDVLQASGRLDGLFHSLGRFSNDFDALGAHRRSGNRSGVGAAFTDQGGGGLEVGGCGG